MCGVPYAGLSIVMRDTSTPAPVVDIQASAWQAVVETKAAWTLTPTITPTNLPVATWTVTPVPSATAFQVALTAPGPEIAIDTFALSFYDPGIGADVWGYVPQEEYEKLATTNCLDWNFDTRVCNSRVNFGRDAYEIWFRKGAACSDVLPYGTLFYVVSPVQLSGYWRCIDRGALDVNGLHYIDFLLDYPSDLWTGGNVYDFPFNTPVQIQVIN